MLYIALIYYPEEGREDQRERIWRDYGAFTEQTIASGQFKAGDALAPSSAATTLRIRDGRKHVMDGPFAETKEQLGGFCVLECADLDEAIEFASAIPDAHTGSIELRPLAQHPYCHNESAAWRRSG